MGGLKIAPAVIEETLGQHPAVVEVVAIGGSGPDGIEEIIIVMVPRRPVSEQAIIDWCAERGIPVARVIEVDELPKTELGKIHRYLVRQQHGRQ